MQFIAGNVITSNKIDQRLVRYLKKNCILPKIYKIELRDDLCRLPGNKQALYLGP